MNRSLLHILLLLLFAMLFTASCSDDPLPAPGVRGADHPTVTFTLKIPGDAPVQSRAMTTSEEERIDHIYVLAFVQDQLTNDYLYSYRAKARAIQLSGATVQFMVELKEYGTPQKFVILPNSENYIPTGTPNGLLYTDDIDTALSKLIARSDYEWKAHINNTAQIAYIPMYAQTEAFLVNRNTTSIGSSAYNLIRMLARIDISLKASVNNFRIRSANLFNRKNMGYIAYKDANWDNTNQKVTTAEVPTTATGFTTTKLPSVTYMADANTHDIAASIYTFETTATTQKKDATAIVVGGYYDYPANQSEITYYRIDIPAFTAAGVEKPGTFGDILRNHKYNINIKSVSQPGAPDPEAAFDGVIRMTADIIPWNLADMDDVKFEGVYGLKVSQSTFITTKIGATNQQLTVFTDYDEGWKGTLVPATATSWIQFTSGTPLEGVGSVSKTLTFDILPNNTGQVGRHAVLKVRAGGITKYVDIFQADAITGDIFDWTNSEMEGISELDGPYRLGVSRGSYSLPKNALEDIPLMVSTDCPKGWVATPSVSWITITANDISSTPGSATLLFDVKENATGAHRSGTIRIKAGNLVKVIIVKQDNNADAEPGLEILPWKDSNHDKDTDLDGPYVLDVSRGSYALNKNTYTSVPLVITTDWSKGWKATTPTNWINLTANTSIPSAGSATLRFDVQENASGAHRMGTIRVQADNMVKIIIVKQDNNADAESGLEILPWEETDHDKDTDLDGPYALEVSRGSYALNKNEYKDVPLVIATDWPKGWKVTTPTAWISLTANESSSSAGSATLRFDVAENSTKAARSGTIYIQAGNNIKVVTVQQDNLADAEGKNTISPWEESNHDKDTDLDGPYMLDVSRGSYDLHKNVYTSVPLIITTDWPKGWKVTTTTPWISLTANESSSSAGTATLRFDVTENTTRTIRTGTIRVQAGNNIKVITVRQDNVADTEGNKIISPWEDSEHDKDTDLDGPYRLDVSRGSYNLHKNTYTNVPLIIATDWPKGWKVTTLTPWISLTANESSATAGTKTLLFDVQENATKTARSGTINIQAGNNIKVVTVRQDNVSDTEGSNPISPWGESDQEKESDMGGLYNLRLSRSDCRYDGAAKSRILTVTADGGGNWKATTTTPWITLTTASGAANGSQTNLTYDVAAYPSGVDRVGKITVTAGNVVKDIRIVQYAGAAIAFTDVLNLYETHNKIHKFTIKAKAPWVAQVQSDMNGAIEQLRTSSGIANWAGSDFLFTIYGGKSSTATVRVQSAGDEFDYYDVQLNLSSN